MRGRDPGADLPHPALDEGADLGGDAADVPAQDDPAGDGVAHAVPLDLGAGDDGDVERRHRARHDRLQREDHLGGDDERVDEPVRSGRVPADTGHGDLEPVLGGHQWARPGRQVAGRQAGGVVQAEHRVDGEPGEQPVVDHRAGAAAVLLGGLEHEPDRARDVVPVHEPVRGAEHHRHVPVVAAGVHRALVAGAVRPVLAALGEARASMSARSPTDVVPPRASVATTPVPPTPRTTSSPRSARTPAT